MLVNQNVSCTGDPPLVELSRAKAEAGRLGEEVLDLSQAVVDVPPPPEFGEAVAKAMADGAAHGYSPDQGLPELRESLASYLEVVMGKRWDPETELLVTAGANQAAYAVLTCLCSPGDQVILPSPYYFNHAMTLTLLGAEPVCVPGNPSKNFVPDPARLLEMCSSKTKGLVLVNPNNPTGSRYRDSLVEDMALLAAEKDLFLLSDQTYHEIYFGLEAPVSPASLQAAECRTVTVGSFSKSFGLAGWRIGFIAGPSNIVRECLKVQDSSVICAPTPSQLGLLAVLEKGIEHSALVRKILKERRDILVEELAVLSDESLLEFSEPGGACFLFARLPKGSDDKALAIELLEREAVAVVPGSVFGTGGRGCWRLSFGGLSGEDLRDACQRIVRFLEARFS